MGLIADMRLFARKGEAAPAGVGLNQFPAEEPMPVEVIADGSACGKRGSGESGGLSFLIHRRKSAVPDDAAPSRASAPPPSQSHVRPRSACASAPAAGRSASTPGGRQQDGARSNVAGAANGPSTGDEAPETWHKLSFRVRNDQYRKLKALSGLWGASYQGILERAVAAFVDSAIGAEEADWDA